MGFLKRSSLGAARSPGMFLEQLALKLKMDGWLAGWLDGRGMFLSKLQRVGNHRAWRQEDGNNDLRWWGFRKMHSVRGTGSEKERMCVMARAFGNWNVGEKFCIISRRDEKTNAMHLLCARRTHVAFFQAPSLRRWLQTNKLCAAIKFLHGTLMRQNFACMCECRLASRRAQSGRWWKGMNLRWNNYTAAASPKKRNWI